MPVADISSRLTPYVEELLDNDYARESMREGGLKLRAGAKALASGRRKPPGRRGRRLLLLLGISIVGAGLALAADEDLRSSLFGAGSEAETSEGNRG
ncbi:MAG TPA: hypothetical protein VK471_12085 [Solirubrobacterales bacterium]|nr:hypothetical protein [Solirubrobacterales bacterium]